MSFSHPLLCSCLLLFTLAWSALTPSHLLRKYSRSSGRDDACPLHIEYKEVTPGLVIHADDVRVDGSNCTGFGGKVLTSGKSAINAGLLLPTLVTRNSVLFYAGVESAPRVCGAWPFNASAISWFLTSTDKFTDRDTGIRVHPGYMYAIYSHFTDLCVYQSSLSKEEQDDIRKSNSDDDDDDDGSEGDPSPSVQKGEDEMSCFPADASVKLSNGSKVSMSSLQIGDRVLASGDNEFSTVYAFSHDEPHTWASFVEITTVSGEVLALSHGHLLYANGRMTPARYLQRGDFVHLADRRQARVASTQTVLKRGLYNPQTLNGDIVVNDVLATTWTTTVTPTIAQSLLLPARIAHMVLPRADAQSSVWRAVFHATRMLPTLPQTLRGEYT